jgi:Mg-chelatase subunit ChlD
MNLDTYQSVVRSAYAPLCPTCRAPIRHQTPGINIALRDIVRRLITPTGSTGSAGSSAAFVAQPFKGVRLSVSAETLPLEDGNKLLHIQVKAPIDGEEEGADYILGIDESGSMNSVVWVAVDKARMGATRCGLVAHVIRTMVAMMTEKDRVAIVSFNDVAKIRLELTAMTADGKVRLNHVLDGIYPDHSTNIYGAIEKMAEIANQETCRGRRLVGVLLTDGQPTESIPPVTGGRCTMPTIQERIRVTNPWQLHTIAFSSEANSSLLEQLAVWGGGRMLFVSSGDMVSTNGINFMAYEKGIASTGIMIDYMIGEVHYTVATGSVAFGAKRDLYIPLPAGATTVKGMSAVGADTYEMTPGEEERHLCRHAFVNLLTSILREAQAALASCAGWYSIVPDLERRLNAFYARFAASADPQVKAMLRDVSSDMDGEQQVRIALMHLNEGGWGLPYLRAYRDHLRAQVCMNFKDPGLKIFETPRFLAHQAAGDAAFSAIPPPHLQREGAAAATVSYPTAFNNSSGSCFEGSMPVVMANGSLKQIRDIRRDDRVKVPGGESKVRYAVEFNIYAPSQPMVQLTPRVAVTPWHPCRRIGESTSFVFPANLVQYAARPLQTVYNLVLESGHIIESDGYHFVTLGHGFEEVPLYHGFFGTSRCIQALEGQPGAAEGRPVYKNCIAIKKDGIIVDWEDRTEDCNIA